MNNARIAELLFKDFMFAATEPPPKKDCQECRHFYNNADGGHCYMFRDEPKSAYCGAFAQVKSP